MKMVNSCRPERIVDSFYWSYVCRIIKSTYLLYLIILMFVELFSLSNEIPHICSAFRPMNALLLQRGKKIELWMPDTIIANTIDIVISVKRSNKH